MIKLSKFITELKKELKKVDTNEFIVLNADLECSIVVRKGIPYVIELNETILEGTIFQKIKMSVMVE